LRQSRHTRKRGRHTTGDGGSVDFAITATAKSAEIVTGAVGVLDRHCIAGNACSAVAL